MFLSFGNFLAVSDFKTLSCIQCKGVQIVCFITFHTHYVFHDKKKYHLCSHSTVIYYSLGIMA